MKFSSSSSSSSSPTTYSTTTNASSAAAAITFDAKMCSTRSGCLAAMLRRILCFTGLPTHPSDQIRDTEIGFHNLGCLETSTSVAAAPGIVGKLMGLESMPGMDLAQTQMNSNTISRSRSMNYDSYRDVESVQGEHRRSKTSLSVREMPTLLVQDEFFVLSFENLGEFGSKAMRSSVGSGKLRRRRRAGKRRSKGESRQSKSMLGEDKENQDTNKVVSDEKLSRRIDEKVVNSSKVEDERNISQISQSSTDCVKQPKPTTKKEKSNGEKQRNLQKVETECNSENSSPVSVLDFSESIIDPEIHTTEEGSRLAGSNSRRKLSSELENHEHLPPCEPRSSNGDVQSKKMSEGKCGGSRKREWQRQSYAELWSEICEMAEGELMESNWIYRELWRLQDFKDISADCGLEILEILLDELVDQLVERPPTKCF